MKRTVFISCLLFFAATVFAQDAQLQEGLALKYLVQLPAEKSAHAPVIILLHGYGADERDLFGLKNSFPKNYLVIAVRAPYPLAAGGYEWYEPAMVNGQHDGNAAQLEHSRNAINKFIAQAVAKYNADAKSVYLIGFSQGAVMCYQAGLTTPEQLKAIAALSGMIFPSLKAMQKNSAALQRLKIFIAHGTADNRIPFADGKAAYDYIKSIGLQPGFHEYAGMGHTISNEVMDDLVKWMK